MEPDLMELYIQRDSLELELEQVNADIERLELEEDKEVLGWE